MANEIENIEMPRRHREPKLAKPESPIIPKRLGQSHRPGHDARYSLNASQVAGIRLETQRDSLAATRWPTH